MCSPSENRQRLVAILNSQFAESAKLEQAIKANLRGWVMAGEKREATFQQLLDEKMLEIGDGYRAQNSELGGNGPIFLRAGHITDSDIDFADVDGFHEHLADKVRLKLSKVGDGRGSGSAIFTCSSWLTWASRGLPRAGRSELGCRRGR